MPRRAATQVVTQLADTAALKNAPKARLRRATPDTRAAIASSGLTSPVKSTRTDGLSHLESLQAWRLRRLANLTGTAAGGTKKDLLAMLRISCGLDKPDTPGRLQPGRQDQAILSVDMGIRNLAYCILKIEAKPTQGSKISDRKFRIAAWRRLDVVATSDSTRGKPKITPVTATRVPPKTPSKGSTEQPDVAFHRTKVPNNAPDPEPKEIVPPSQVTTWSPSALAPHAIRLTHHLLSQLQTWRQSPSVPHPALTSSNKPRDAEPSDTTILIERQRYRSGGGSQVQEWTLRVNTLEAMLWTALSILRPNTQRSRPSSSAQHPHPLTQTAGSNHDQNPHHQTLEMSPARVCAFWTHRRASLLSASRVLPAGTASTASTAGSSAAKSQAGSEVEWLVDAGSGSEADFEAMLASSSSSSTSSSPPPSSSSSSSPTTPGSEADLSSLLKHGDGHEVPPSGAQGVVRTQGRGFAKGEKIQLVRGWFGEGSLGIYEQDVGAESTESPRSRGSLDDAELRDRIRAFLEGGKAPREIREGKLDDLADCVVQGVTYALWEEHRAELRRFVRGGKP